MGTGQMGNSVNVEDYVRYHQWKGDECSLCVPYVQHLFPNPG